jgi:hypothetical protein
MQMNVRVTPLCFQVSNIFSDFRDVQIGAIDPSIATRLMLFILVTKDVGHQFWWSSRRFSRRAPCTFPIRFSDPVTSFMEYARPLIKASKYPPGTGKCVW